MKFASMKFLQMRPYEKTQRLSVIKLFSRSQKEINDLDIFDSGVNSIYDFGEDDLMPHFIYCGFYYMSSQERTEQLKEMILTKMRKYGIQSSILTILNMGRLNLVTKEKVKKAAEGKLKNDPDWVCLLYTSPSPRDRG